MAIDLATGFNIGSKDAIDERQVLTLEQMKNLDESIYPDKYFAICKDDSMLYVYNVNNPVDAETGKFRKVGSNESVDTSIFQKINDDSLTTDDKTIVGAINEIDLEIDNLEVLDKEDIETMLGLSDEELNTMANLISDDEVRVDKTYSSSKIVKLIEQYLVTDSVDIDAVTVNGKTLVSLTKEEYDNLEVKDENSLYIISDISEEIDNKLNEKVDKVEGSSLVSDTEIAKIHEHSNQDVLNNLTKDADSGKLLFEDTPISDEVNIATVNAVGTTKPDGTTITITDDGTISATTYVLPSATDTTLGGVKVDNVTITVDSEGVITAIDSYTKTEADDLLTNKLDKEKVVQDITMPDTESVLSTEGLNTILDTKVDKVEGKCLSTYDFTSERASILNRFHNYGKNIFISNVMTVSYFPKTTIEPQSQVILEGTVTTYNTVLGTSNTNGDKRTTFLSGQYQGTLLSRSCFHFYNPTSINTNILWPIQVTTYNNGIGAKITIKNISTTESVTIPGYAGNNKTAFAIMIDLPTNAIETL